MALTNHTELVAAINAWVVRSSSQLDANQVTDFITLAEGHLNRNLRTRFQEALSNGVLTGNSLDISSDLGRFRKMKTFWLVSGTEKFILNYVSPAQYIARHPDGTSGVPLEYTILGNSILLNPPPSDSYDWYAWYYQTFSPLLSGSNDLIVNYPDAYLSASLAEAFAYLKKPDEAAYWLQRREAIIRDINQAHVNDRHGGTSMQTTEMRAV